MPKEARLRLVLGSIETAQDARQRTLRQKQKSPYETGRGGRRVAALPILEARGGQDDIERSFWPALSGRDASDSVQARLLLGLLLL